MIRVSPRWLALAPVALGLACNKTPARELTFQALGKTDDAFVAVGSQRTGDKLRGLVMRSTDGQTWSEIALEAPGPLQMVAVGKAGLVAVGPALTSASSAAGAGGQGGGGKPGAGGKAGGSTAGAGGEAGSSGGSGQGGDAGAAGEGGAGGAGGNAAGAAGGDAGLAGGGGETGQPAAGSPGNSFADVDPEGPGAELQEDEASRPPAAGVVMVSRDGLSWRAAANPPDDRLLDVATNDEGFVAMSARGLYWSSDGDVWLRQPVGSQGDEQESWSQIEGGEGRYVALGPQPAVSKDGRIWRAITSIPKGELRGLRFTNGAFYSVGRVGGFFGGVGEENCILVRSVDGETWQAIPSAAPGCARDVADSGERFLFMTSRGVFDAPSIAGPWGKRTELEGGLALRAEWKSGRWALAAQNGLWTSPDGASWVRVFKAP